MSKGAIRAKSDRERSGSSSIKPLARGASLQVFPYEEEPLNGAINRLTLRAKTLAEAASKTVDRILSVKPISEEHWRHNPRARGAHEEMIHLRHQKGELDKQLKDIRKNLSLLGEEDAQARYRGLVTAMQEQIPDHEFRKGLMARAREIREEATLTAEDISRIVYQGNAELAERGYSNMPCPGCGIAVGERERAQLGQKNRKQKVLTDSQHREWHRSCARYELAKLRNA